MIAGLSGSNARSDWHDLPISEQRAPWQRHQPECDA
jgi:hypothetical protein